MGHITITEFKIAIWKIGTELSCYSRRKQELALKCVGQLHRKKSHQNESGIASEKWVFELRSGNGHEKMRSKDLPGG